MKYPDDFLNKIICGDCLKVMKDIPDNCIDMVLTSPPYWALRDYGVEGQLGLEPTFQEYIKKLCDIFNEVKRVLKKDGTCWVNMGDTYGGSGKGAGGYSNKSTLQGYTGEHTKGRTLAKESWNFKKAPKSEGDVSKSLCQIPSRFAIEMTNRGWILRNEIIWHKPNCMPSSVKDRFTVDFEKVFFFVKNKKYWFETQYESYAPSSDVRYRQALRSNKEYETKAPYRNNTPYARYKYGQGSVKHRDNVAPQNHLLVGGNNEGRNKRCVWKVTTKPFPEAHFATYPEALIRPMIKAGCPEKGIVLDPFMGAGTTALVAMKNNRNYIGIELNPDYIKIAEKRLEQKPLI